MHDTSSLLVVARAADVIPPAAIVSAKIAFPSLPSTFLPRPHLLARLAGEPARKLTLLVAPAGYGKTTLLTEWLLGKEQQTTNQRRTRAEIAASSAAPFAPAFSLSPSWPVAWLALDSNDNDPRRFWTYVAAALERSHPQITTALQPLIEQTPLPQEQIVTTLNNLLATSDRELLLVLDEYHTITSASIHRSMSALMEHLPSSAHLVIASRAMPALPLALLRARNQVVELSVPDLRFTRDEIGRLLNGLLLLDLSPDNLLLVEERSEGWAAGLHLIALALQNAPTNRWMPAPQRRSMLLSQISGSHHYLADYFFEEVFARQSPEIQSFLLQTAVLDRLSGPLCDSVTQIENPAPNSENSETSTIVPLVSNRHSRFLHDELERANLFMVPLDGERRWYRYHHLFREMLRDRLERTAPHLVPILHRRAASWYEAQGQPAAAVDHALAAGDTQSAAQLVEASARAILMRGELRTLRHWLHALGEAQIHSRPSLALLQSWMALFEGDLTQAEDWLERATRGFASDDMEQQTGWSDELRAIKTIATALRGDLDQAEQQAREALAELPSNELFVRSVLTLALSMIALLRGDQDGANRIFLEAVRIAQAAGNIFVALAGLCELAERRAQGGQLGRARALYEQALHLAVDDRGEPLPIAGAAYIGLGELLREQNDLDGAEHMLLNGVALSKGLDECPTFEGYIGLARLYGARGDLAAARQALWQAKQLTSHGIVPYEETLVVALEAQLALDQGDLTAAVGWLKESHSTAPNEGLHALHSKNGRVMAGSIAARVLLAQGRYNEALRLLGVLLGEAERTDRLSDVVALLGIEAMVHHALGDTPTTFMALQRALALAAPAGYIRTLLDLGASFVEVLQEARRLALQQSALVDSLTLEYIEHLLLAVPSALEQTPAQPTEEPQPTRSLLSERERAILRRIAAGLSTAAIATEFVVAPSTIKTHIKNIFAKLDVHNRVQALARAQELQLLS